MFLLHQSPATIIISNLGNCCERCKVFILVWFLCIEIKFLSVPNIRCGNKGYRFLAMTWQCIRHMFGVANLESGECCRNDFIVHHSPFVFYHGLLRSLLWFGDPRYKFWSASTWSIQPSSLQVLSPSSTQPSCLQIFISSNTQRSSVLRAEAIVFNEYNFLHFIFSGDAYNVHKLITFASGWLWIACVVKGYVSHQCRPLIKAMWPSPWWFPTWREFFSWSRDLLFVRLAHFLLSSLGPYELPAFLMCVVSKWEGL